MVGDPLSMCSAKNQMRPCVADVLEPIASRSGRSGDPAGASGGSLPHYGHVGETAREDLPQ